jgi:hypothetical protein
MLGLTAAVALSAAAAAGAALTYWSARAMRERYLKQPGALA